MTSHCTKGNLYSLSGSDFPEKGERILMEYPFKYNPNYPEQYIDAELVEVTWLGKEPGKPYYKVQDLSGMKKTVWPGPSNFYTFYKCQEPEAGDPTPLEGGRSRRRQKRKTRKAKKTKRTTRRRRHN
jgi:hypothetical protein